MCVGLVDIWVDVDVDVDGMADVDEGRGEMVEEGGWDTNGRIDEDNKDVCAEATSDNDGDGWPAT